LTILASEYLCLKLETAEIKLSFNHIVEKGKEIGIKVGMEVSGTLEKIQKGKKKGKKGKKGKKRSKPHEDV
jgi:hypothetical protein